MAILSNPPTPLPLESENIKDLAVITSKLAAFAVTLAKIDPTLIGFKLLSTFAATNVGSGAYTDVGIASVSPVFLIRARLKNGTALRHDINIRVNGVASGSYRELVFGGAIPVLAVGVNKVLFGGLNGGVDGIQEIGFLVQGDLLVANAQISVNPLWGHIDGNAYTAWGALDSNVGVTSVGINVAGVQTDINGDVYILETLSTDV